MFLDFRNIGYRAQSSDYKVLQDSGVPIFTYDIHKDQPIILGRYRNTLATYLDKHAFCHTLWIPDLTKSYKHILHNINFDK